MQREDLINIFICLDHYVQTPDALGNRIVDYNKPSQILKPIMATVWDTAPACHTVCSDWPDLVQQPPTRNRMGLDLYVSDDNSPLWYCLTAVWNVTAPTQAQAVCCLLSLNRIQNSPAHSNSSQTFQDWAMLAGSWLAESIQYPRCPQPIIWTSKSKRTSRKFKGFL